jgi:hypothetical protein
MTQSDNLTPVDKIEVVDVVNTEYRTHKQMLTDFPYLKNLGNHNSLPEPFREVDEHYYRHHVHLQCARVKQYRQIIMDKTFFPADIFFYSHYALAVMLPVEWKSDDSTSGGIRYTKPIKYFHIGCNHQWDGQFTPEEEKSLLKGQCIHNRKCSQCGMILVQDSSD